MFTLRPAQEADAAVVTQLINRDSGELATVEQVRARILAASAIRQVLRLVAVRERGDVVAYGHILREDWMEPGLFWMHTVVDAATRCQGIGTGLCDALFEWAGERGGAMYRGQARDNMPESLRFAERRGFQLDRHIFESVLDLTTFDERPFVATLDAARAAGVRFFSLADLGDTMDARRRLYEVERVVARDIPGGSESATRPFEIFLREVCDPTHYRPETQLVAADGEVWVGLAGVLDFPANSSMYNGVTGVLPAYRGRGIATALKLLAIRAARQHGAATIRTNNDAQNAPMLAINRKLGYQPEPGYYRLLKTIAV